MSDLTSVSWIAAPDFTRRRRLLWGGLLIALFLVAPLASGAGAHATLVGTAPADDELVEQAPEQVELRFDEEVETVEGGLQVIAPDGERADRGETRARDSGATLLVPIDDAGEGTYTVAWRVVSRDGHNLSGSFVYHVGRRTGAATLDSGGDTLADAVGGVGRWAAFAGALVVVGTGALAATAAVGTDDRARRRLRTILVVASGVGAAGVAASLVAQSAAASGRDLLDAVGVTPDMALDTRSSALTVMRGGALIVAGLLALLPWTARWPLAAAGAGLVSLVGASLAGHAWTAPARAVAVVSDAVHVLAVGAWLGGLLGLLAILRLVAEPASLVRRFSNASLVAVAAVAVTGVVSGVVEVRSFDALFSTGYGQLLLAKLAGFTLLVALGFYNRQILLPRIEQALSRLAGSVRVELVVAVAMLGITAVLVNQPPARDQAEAAEDDSAGPFSGTVTSDDGSATMQATVDPAEVGPNDLHLFFYDADGTELVVTAVEVTASVDDLPPRRLTVTPATAFHVLVLDASLSSPGLWTFEVTAVSGGRPIVFELEVPL